MSGQAEVRSAPAVRWAAFGVLAALVVMAWTAWRMWQVTDVPAAPPGPMLSTDALITPARPESVDVDAAVSLDLFNPDRAAPIARYRLPSDPAAVASDMPPPARPVVLGTAIASDGSSFATCQLESSRLLMVRVGDKVGVYLVKSIERGRVVFQTPAGERLEIQALRPGS
ncbi:MAG: hypothetical protein IPJ11_12615 [Gemmatimonadetes bacterium]|nr:hypothetical protein [Gemmatimonadota bacterium]